MQLCNGTTDSILRVKCIGTLECLAQFPNSIDGNKVQPCYLSTRRQADNRRQVISEYLLSLLPTGTTPSTLDTEPLIQTVSALIDIYSDEDMVYDVNFRQGSYLQRLVASVDGVRKCVKGINRGKEGGKELKRRGEEVRDNLVAFIKYRRNLGL